jgi:hypothetical protein
VGSNPADAVTTGWTTGWRSIAWYTSGSTHVTVPFTGVKNVYRISLSQLDNATYTRFSAFKISYSLDGFSYIEFPEVSKRQIRKLNNRIIQNTNFIFVFKEKIDCY